uniref:RUS family member 1 n=1 Tax=Sphenodon punctatus TaxID=8508 RepID=A0A8D0GW98_SPHPU
MPNLGGQPLCTETYGPRWPRHYHPSPDGCLRCVPQGPQDVGYGSLRGIFMSVFLPQGYPESVSPDYLPYQLWDTVQAFASSITGALATQAVLRGVGVGDQASTVTAATVTWLLKDGTGMLGRILFAWMKGSKLDCDAKQWRLFADVLNDVAIFMEIVAPAFPACFTAIVCASGLAKETLVNLAGLLVSLLLLPLVTNNLLLTYTLYGLFTALHLYANYRAVRAVCMETLNYARLRLVLRHFLRHGEVPHPTHINPQEPLVPGFERRLGLILGAPVHSLVSTVSDFQNVLKETNAKRYLISFRPAAGTVSVALHPYAESVDVIHACVHALLLETLLYQDLPPTLWEGSSLLALQCKLQKDPNGDVWASLAESHQVLDRIFPAFLAGKRLGRERA